MSKKLKILNCDNSSMKHLYISDFGRQYNNQEEAERDDRLWRRIQEKVEAIWGGNKESIARGIMGWMLNHPEEIKELLSTPEE